MTTIEQIRGQTTEERGTMNRPRNVLSALACTLLVSAIPSGMAYAHDDDGDRHHGDKDFKIEVLSSRPYMVSGGDALVRVTVRKTDVNLGSVRIELNGANVTGAFRCIKRFLPLTHLSGRNVISSSAIVQHISRNDRDDCDRTNSAE